MSIKTNTKVNKRKVAPAKARSVKLIPKKFIFFSFIIGAVICGSVVLQQHMDRFAITTVKIHGQIVRTSEQEIWDSINKLLDKGFFGTNVAVVQTELQKLPWIASAKVEKMWPDKLSVTVVEKIPVARWRGKGLVTTAGDIMYLDALSKFDKLPIFWGHETQAKAMLENYLTISNILKEYELSITQIEIMPDHGMRTTLNNEIVLFLGQEGLLERLNRFTLAYQNKLQKVSHKINYIDLRYVNGIAVGWKDSITKLYLERFFNNEDYKVNA